MVYQYDLALPLPTKDLYDTLIMQMALTTAKDMYDRGEKRIDDFYEKYGDFYTPITKDLETYNSYIDNIRNVVNDLYSKGIDPLRSAEGRSVVADAIRKFPRQQVANIKQSAKNAEMFNKAKLALMLAGLYNPDMDPYNGGTPENWDTVGSGKIFDVLSPTPYKDLASFSEPYFKGLKPNIKNESRNGISYSVESITEDDLRKVADSKYNDLINTQLGRLMYMRYKDLAGGNENVARQMFNDAIVDANKWRTYIKDDYDDNYYKQKQLWLTEQKFKHDVEKDAADLQLKRDQLAATLKIAGMRYGDDDSKSSSSSSSGSGSGSAAGEYKDDQYQLARSIGGAIASTQTGMDLGILDYSDFNEDAMSETWPIAYREIVDDVYGDFINKYNLRPNREIRVPERYPIGFKAPRIYQDENGTFKTTPLETYKPDMSIQLGVPTGHITPASLKNVSNYKQAKKDLQNANQSFINRLATNYDASKFTEWVHKPVSSGSDKNMIIISNDDDAVNRLHTIDELSMNSFGIEFEDIKGRFKNENGSMENLSSDIISTKSLRKMAKNKDRLLMKSISKVVPILDKDGVTHLYQLVKLFEEKGKAGTISYNPIAGGLIYAYDMGIVTQKNPNFGLAGNISSNLYLDENRDADARQVGNIKVNKDLNVSNTKVKSSPFIFPWQQ